MPLCLSCSPFPERPVRERPHGLLDLLERTSGPLGEIMETFRCYACGTYWQRVQPVSGVVNYWQII
jgi:hypothetical protein